MLFAVHSALDVELLLLRLAAMLMKNLENSSAHALIDEDAQAVLEMLLTLLTRSAWSPTRTRAVQLVLVVGLVRWTLPSKW
eukprot:Skav228169  [mRNA]  locus=scaffold439:516169:516837:+ [translate_table: standard]